MPTTKPAARIRVTVTRASAFEIPCTCHQKRPTQAVEVWQKSEHRYWVGHRQCDWSGISSWRHCLPHEGMLDGGLLGALKQWQLQEAVTASGA